MRFANFLLDDLDLILQSMRMDADPDPPAAALVAKAIARIEERRDALDRLAAKGMEMLERIAAGETVEIASRKPFADPERAFAVVSRAVRLCLALASRLDEALISLLRGGPIPDLPILAPEVAAAPPSPRERIARAVDAPIETEVGDGEVADRLRAALHERLIERECYDAYLHLPWRVVVDRICADLGLRPWSTEFGRGNPHPQSGRGGPPLEAEESGDAELPAGPRRPPGATPRHPPPPLGGLPAP